jgi:hypothetical protein
MNNEQRTMNNEMEPPMDMPQFPLGQIVATPGALRALQESGESPNTFLGRHMRGDWGEICDEDRGLNDRAVLDGSRILSVYRTLNDVKVWVITDAEDNAGDRAATTILLPSEY